jgi:hypothetical protein
MRRNGFWVVSVITLASASALEAQEPVFSGRHLFVEQDEFAKPWGLGGDQNYTMGVGLQLTGSFVRWSGFGHLHHLIDRLIAVVRIPASPDYLSHETFHSLTLVGSAFTPDDLTQTGPVIGDRPYASLLGLSSRRVSPRGIEDEWAFATELIVGALGLGVSREIQTWIHERLDSDIPVGWHNQISDGGELTGAYHFGAQRRLTPFYQDGVQKRFEASLDADVWLGYYTNVSLGGTARLGRIYSRYFEFTSAPIAGVSQALVRHRAESEAFVFIATRVRGVLYNALLQGQSRDNVYELERDEIKPLLAELEAGAHGSIGLGSSGFSLYGTWVMVAGRSSEIDTSYGRAHWWGSAQLGLTRAYGP